MTPAQAQAYFNSVPAAEKQAVQASGADITAWANASEAAGDPRALQFSGSRQAAEGGGLISTSAPSAPVAAGGIPTPAQLRAKAKAEGWSEDFERFSDAQLAAWLSKSWDPASGRFKNDAGDIVEKPTESGPQSEAKGWATGEASTAGYWRPDRGGAGGGGAAAPGGGAAAPTSGPLANALFRQWAAGQGQFGLGQAQPGQTQVASTLPGGGLWWGQQATPGAAGTAAAAPAPTVAPAAAARPAASPAVQGVQTSLSNLFGFTAPQAPGAPAALPAGGGIDLTQFLPADIRTSKRPLTKALMDSGDWGGDGRTPLMA